MKNYLMIALVGGAFSAGAQSLVGSGGETHKNGTGSINVSVGEPVVNTHKKSNGVVTQGFQQGRALIVTAVDEVARPYEVFPNPTFSYVTIKSGVIGTFDLHLSDLTGKSLLTKTEVSSGDNLYFENFPAGIYLVKLVSTDKKTIQSFKITKR